MAHILATRTPAPKVNEASMGVPPDRRTKSSTLPDGTGAEPLGHQDQGSTIAIHSLAVLPEHQGKRIGWTLMKAYIQRIKDAAVADRIALLAHDNLVPFYTALGFEDRGASDCTFGGGGWIDMVSSLNPRVSWIDQPKANSLELTSSLYPTDSRVLERVIRSLCEVGSA